MQGEKEGGKPRGESQACLTPITWIGQSQSQNPKGDKVKDDRIGDVQDEARQMVAEGVHAPEQVVQAQGHPGQRDPVTHVKRGGPHPAELGPAEAAIVRVVEEIVRVVPVHELVLQRGQERREGDDSNQDGDQSQAPSPEQRAGERLTALALEQFGLPGLESRLALVSLPLAAHEAGRARGSLRRGTVIALFLNPT